MPTTPRILVVDDDPAVRAIARRVLGREGYGLAEASSLEEAIAATDAAPFDLVLTDFVMPDGRGDMLETALRARGSRAVVLYMSGYGDTLNTERGIPLDKIVSKPFTARDLVERVRDVFLQHAA